MEKDQLIKTLNEAEEHIFKARRILYDIYKEIEDKKRKVEKDGK